MADRRMFTKKITEADEFTSMPPSTQALYFHLCMNCDDDGFSNQIRQAMFNAHASTDDMNTLVNKHFVIPFESGVIVIKHWRMHNYIQNDRYHKTQYFEEIQALELKDNGVYTLKSNCDLDTSCIQNVSKMETEVSIGKVSIDKDNNNMAILPKAKVAKNDIEANFEMIWKLYPKKKGKGQVSLAQKTKLFKITYEEMERAINRFIEDNKDKDDRYVMYGSTFFNSGYVDYLDANYEERSNNNGRTVKDDKGYRAEDFYGGHTFEDFGVTGDEECLF